MGFLAQSAESIESRRLVYLGVAYAAVWIFITAYLFTLARRQSLLEKRLKQFEATPGADQAEQP